MDFIYWNLVIINNRWNYWDEGWNEKTQKYLIKGFVILVRLMFRKKVLVLLPPLIPEQGMMHLQVEVRTLFVFQVIFSVIGIKCIFEKAQN